MLTLYNNIYIEFFYLNNPAQSLTERQVVGRNCRTPGVRDGRDATLPLQVLNYLTINGTTQRP